jgi:adenylate cyclase
MVVAADVGADEPGGSRASPVEMSDLLDGLEGDARRDRAELIAWLLGRGFSADQIRGSLAPMMLPANRMMGDYGLYVSAREMSRMTGVELELLQQLQRAVGLPRIDDPDAAVLARVDAEAAARTTFFVDFGIDTEEAVALVRVLMEGLHRAVATMQETAYRMLVEPGASEVKLAQTAEALTRQAMPRIGPMIEGLLLLEFRRMFEAEGIGAAERATGRLPGARQVAVAFADLVGFTQLGEALPPEDLARLASRFAELAHDVVVAPVWFIKTIGDAVMLVSPEPVVLVNTVLELVEVAAVTSGLPQLRAGVATGLAVSHGGDWYGSPVNMASRVTGVARHGTVLVTESARESVGGAEGFQWSSAGTHHLKGIPGQVELFRVSRVAH